MEGAFSHQSEPPDHTFHTGCTGGRVGHLVTVLSLFNSADTSIMIAWTAASKHENPEHRESATVLKYEINPR